VNNYYDSSDECGVAWDDPTLAVPWGVEAPVLSPRDRKNRRLRDIPADELPQ
jgi:dTDP-4-dehydrorhamnose 3,5-epimerase